MISKPNTRNGFGQRGRGFLPANAPRLATFLVGGEFLTTDFFTAFGGEARFLTFLDVFVTDGFLARAADFFLMTSGFFFAAVLLPATTFLPTGRGDFFAAECFFDRGRGGAAAGRDVGTGASSSAGEAALGMGSFEEAGGVATPGVSSTGAGGAAAGLATVVDPSAVAGSA